MRKVVSMAKTDNLTKSLAFVATVLVWFPLLAPFLFWLAALAGGGRFFFDFLTPAELFPLILLGALLNGMCCPCASHPGGTTSADPPYRKGEVQSGKVDSRRSFRRSASRWEILENQGFNS